MLTPPPATPATQVNTELELARAVAALVTLSQFGLAGGLTIEHREAKQWAAMSVVHGLSVRLQRLAQQPAGSATVADVLLGIREAAEAALYELPPAYHPGAGR